MKKTNLMLGLLLPMLFICCKTEHHKEHEIGTFEVSTPILSDTSFFNNYVSQIHAHQHIELRALEKGYLERIFIDEGQFVRKGQLLFKIQPTIYEAEVLKSKAEVEFAEIEYKNTKALADSNIVSQSELALANAALSKANAELTLMKAHLNFTEIRAPFDGIVGKFEDVRLGSLLDEGEFLTTLSDNSTIWVYFNVPEVVYLEYMKALKASKPPVLKLQLANNEIFKNEGAITAIESDFNNTTGTIPFRATFDNTDRLLRHGQTGNILWPVELSNVLIIPQKATFEVLDKKFVFIVDEEGHVRSQEVKIASELDHLYIISDGLKPEDHILIDGLRKVQNGDHIQFTIKSTKEVYGDLELHAE
jgi:membrane fusion protein (multidrug efflux system)